MLKLVAIGGLSVFGVICIITTYACCNVAGRADDWKEEHLENNEDEKRS